MRILFVSTLALMSAFFCGNSFASETPEMAQEVKAPAVENPETSAERTPDISDAQQAQVPAEQPVSTEAQPSAEPAQALPPVQMYKSTDVVNAASIVSILSSENTLITAYNVGKNRFMIPIKANNAIVEAIQNKDIAALRDLVIVRGSENPVYDAISKAFNNSTISDENVKSVLAGVAVPNPNLVAKVLQVGEQFSDIQLKLKEKLHFEQAPISIICILCDLDKNTIEPYWSEKFKEQYGDQYKYYTDLTQLMNDTVEIVDSKEKNISNVLSNYEEVGKLAIQVSENSKKIEELTKERDEDCKDLAAKAEEAKKFIEEQEQQIAQEDKSIQEEQNRVNGMPAGNSKQRNQKNSAQSAVDSRKAALAEKQKELESHKAVISEYDEKAGPYNEQIATLQKSNEEIQEKSGNDLQLYQGIAGKYDQNIKAKLEEIIAR